MTRFALILVVFCVLLAATIRLAVWLEALPTQQPVTGTFQELAEDVDRAIERDERP